MQSQSFDEHSYIHSQNGQNGHLSWVAEITNSLSGGGSSYVCGCRGFGVD